MELDHVVSENQEYEEIESKILGKSRSSTRNMPALSDAQLIDSHGPYALTPKIARVDREEPGYDHVVGGISTQPQRVPTRRWDHCNVCLRLTGTKVYLGGSPDFKRFHLNLMCVKSSSA